MTLDETTVLALLAIAAMALVTHLLRFGGFWLMGRVPLTARMRRALEAMPGVVVSAAVPPIVIDIGPMAIAAVAVAVLLMLLLRNVFAAIAGGVITAAVTRGIGI
jgi:uncharacterized membrane protein